MPRQSIFSTVTSHRTSTARATFDGLAMGGQGMASSSSVLRDEGSRAAAKREVGLSIYACLESMLLRTNCASGAVLMAEDSITSAASVPRAAGGVTQTTPAAVLSAGVIASRRASHREHGGGADSDDSKDDDHARRKPSFMGSTIRTEASSDESGNDSAVPDDTASARSIARSSRLSLPSHREEASSNAETRQSGEVGETTTRRSRPPSQTSTPASPPRTAVEHQTVSSRAEMESVVAAAQLAAAAASKALQATNAAVRFRPLAKIGPASINAFTDLQLHVGCWSTGVAVNYENAQSPFFCFPIMALHGMGSAGTVVDAGAASVHAAPDMSKYVGLVVLADKNIPGEVFSEQDEASIECLSLNLANLMCRYPAVQLLDSPFDPGYRFTTGLELPSDQLLPAFIRSALNKKGSAWLRRVIRTSNSATYPRRNVTQGTFDIPSLQDMIDVAAHLVDLDGLQEAMRARLLHFEQADQANQRRLQMLSKEVVDAQLAAARQKEIAHQAEVAVRTLRQELDAKIVDRVMSTTGKILVRGTVGGDDRSSFVSTDWRAPSHVLEDDARAMLGRIDKIVSARSDLSNTRMERWRQAHPDAAIELDTARLDHSEGLLTPERRGANRGGASLGAKPTALEAHPPPKPPSFLGLPGTSVLKTRPGSSLDHRRDSVTPRTDPIVKALHDELRKAVRTARMSSAARSPRALGPDHS